MRIFTCTPVAFPGTGFFTRDSGLLCRGLQAINIDSKAVMPGERQADDDTDLLRTDYRNLESAKWWREQRLDAVVLYAWGRPKFRMVARAIRDAGIFLVLNQDSAGFPSPLAGWRDWFRALWAYSGQGCDAAAWLRFAGRICRGISMGLLVSDPLRAQHLKQGDVVACVSSKAADRYKRLCLMYGGEPLASRVRVLPHPVESGFIYSRRPKLRQVVCVGRWNKQDEVQKRSSLLMAVLERLMQIDPDVTVVIAGSHSGDMQSWHAALGGRERNRIRLAGRLSRKELTTLLDKSCVFYSPSAYESFGIAAAEALCAGCSVVAARKVTLPSFEWFVSENSGRLADHDDAASHAATLLAELQTWANGGRDAVNISRVWCGRLHADQVAAQVMEMVRMVVK